MRPLHEPPDSSNRPANDTQDTVDNNPGNQDEQDRDNQEKGAYTRNRDNNGQRDTNNQQQKRAQNHQTDDFHELFCSRVSWSAKTKRTACVLTVHLLLVHSSRSLRPVRDLPWILGRWRFPGLTMRLGWRQGSATVCAETAVCVRDASTTGTCLLHGCSSSSSDPGRRQEQRSSCSPAR